METEVQNFYILEIEQSWKPIFAVGQNFVVLNGKVLHKQFPLKPAGLQQYTLLKEVPTRKFVLTWTYLYSKGLQKKEK